MNRYVIGFLACIGLGVLLVILLFSGGGKPKTTTAPQASAKLPSYATTDAQVKMVVDGPIVAPQNHNTVVVTIGQNSSNFDLIQGYDGNVVSSKSYNNTQNSYTNFLDALYYAGFSSGIKSNYTTDAGLCPTGDRYDFYLTQDGETLQHYWVTNCTNSPRTLAGNFNLILTLFEGQIPDINQLASKANI